MACSDANARRGRDVLLKANIDGVSPPNWQTIGGLRGTTFTINGEDVDVTNKDDAGWQKRLAGAGVRSMTVSCDGIYQNLASDRFVRTAGFEQTIEEFLLVNQDGDELEFCGQISTYERGGNHDGAETFSITIESHAKPDYREAPA
jgi:TP901-1 family phage major tail protein